MQELQFETEADVKLWMINNQFDRRNLPIETRMKLAYRFKEIEAEKAKDRMESGKKVIQTDQDYNDPSLLVGHPLEKGKTLEKLAQKAGVSRATAEQYDAIQRKGTEEQKAQVDSGESSIKKVYTQIQRAERLEKYQLSNQLLEVA